MCNEGAEITPLTLSTHFLIVQANLVLPEISRRNRTLNTNTCMKPNYYYKIVVMETSHLFFLFAKNKTPVVYIIILQRNVLSLSFIDLSIHIPVYSSIHLSTCKNTFVKIIPFILPSLFPFLHFSYNRIGMKCTVEA